MSHDFKKAISFGAAVGFIVFAILAGVGLGGLVLVSLGALVHSLFGVPL